MNNLFISISGIIFVTSLLGLIGKFFDISPHYYVPFMVWFIALFLFNIFLEKKHVNVFMGEVK
ncbi:hypothetical protein PGAG_00415 [Phaeocystis globosa virus 12T]|uniref:Uncharacterized protein n=1 Tax=Phaeocystis globosa virus PgV-16T TaxID=3071227 RepID=A0AC59EWK3_9VIRU|nr:hypothetical protein PGCG_00021 [Phaeocystis globosa virus]AET72869.1 hypothetical protein PGAG_00415 [Phaeocystis globosa virus 12T]AET73634.1 hypothetical protein PGBG_00418 [Phaeocystis globosa virus 14T]AGM15333.1 hypothetical protein PGCG_00021 [Phaeocystis globosa virus PgV-16T]UYE94063.1 hypothetical protein PGV14T_00021 [Phaeocystis globosa virus]|tara:strand:+ start:42 stop:230 length:189 start_codon:yes stop_codon:yes gene_type:complete